LLKSENSMSQFRAASWLMGVSGIAPVDTRGPLVNIGVTGSGFVIDLREPHEQSGPLGERDQAALGGAGVGFSRGKRNPGRKLSVSGWGIHMKKFLLATSAIVAFAVTAPAGAADMRVKAAPVYKPACANFGGWFVNGHVGWSRYEYDWNNRDAWGRDFETDIPLTIETSDNGFAGGVGIGFNWQPSCVLFGVDLDYDWASITANEFHTDGNEEETVEVSSNFAGLARSGCAVASSWKTYFCT
jgi:hypothetical protein